MLAQSLNMSSQSKSLRKSAGSRAIISMAKRGTNQVVAAVKSRYTGKAAPKNIASDIKTIMSLMNTEDKQVYTLAATQTVSSTTSLVYGIGTIAQGSASNQRTGDSVKINRIQLNLKFTYSSGFPATAVVESQVYNYYLIRYLKTPSSSGTTAFAISEFLNSDANGNYTPSSFPNPDTNQNFSVIAAGQQIVELPFLPTVAATTSRLVSLDIPVSFHQDYSGSANTTITDNMLFMVFTALNPLNASGNTGVEVNCGIWYIDN
jgi:hypothetical protein